MIRLNLLHPTRKADPNRLKEETQGKLPRVFFAFMGQFSGEKQQRLIKNNFLHLAEREG